MLLVYPVGFFQLRYGKDLTVELANNVACGLLQFEVLMKGFYIYILVGILDIVWQRQLQNVMSA